DHRQLPGSVGEGRPGGTQASGGGPVRRGSEEARCRHFREDPQKAEGKHREGLSGLRGEDQGPAQAPTGGPAAVLGLSFPPPAPPRGRWHQCAMGLPQPPGRIRSYFLGTGRKYHSPPRLTQRSTTGLSPPTRVISADRPPLPIWISWISSDLARLASARGP